MRLSQQLQMWPLCYESMKSLYFQGVIWFIILIFLYSPLSSFSAVHSTSIPEVTYSNKMPFWDLQACDRAVHQQQWLQLPEKPPEERGKWHHAALFCHDTLVTAIESHRTRTATASVAGLPRTRAWAIGTKRKLVHVKKKKKRYP